jgi:hypothetical protein
MSSPLLLFAFLLFHAKNKGQNPGYQLIEPRRDLRANRHLEESLHQFLVFMAGDSVGFGDLQKPLGDQALTSGHHFWSLVYLAIIA